MSEEKFRIPGHCVATVLLAASILIVPSDTKAALLYLSGGDDNPDTGYVFNYTTTGTQSTLASGMKAAWGIAFDSHGNLFAAFDDQNIYKYAPSGSRSTFATGLSNPHGLAVDAAGNLFEADSASGNIYKFTPAGVRSTFASGLVFPYAVAFDVNENAFVTDDVNETTASGVIYKYSPDGSRSTFATGLTAPGGLAFNASGNLYVGDGNTIKQITASGSKSTYATGLTDALGLAFDGSGNLFAADFGLNTVYKYTPTGSRSVFASARFPRYLAFAPNVVPEPGSIALAMVGAAGLLVWGDCGGLIWRLVSHAAHSPRLLWRASRVESAAARGSPRSGGLGRGLADPMVGDTAGTIVGDDTGTLAGHEPESTNQREHGPADGIGERGPCGDDAG